MTELNVRKRLPGGNEVQMHITVEHGIATFRIGYTKPPSAEDRAEAETAARESALAIGMKEIRIH